MTNWSIKNSLCSVCNANCIDDITHYFVLCDSVKTFWQEVFNWWYNLSGTIVSVEIYEILFGVFIFNEDDFLNMLNFVLITAKWFIYRCKKENLNMFINNFLLYLEQTIDIEKYIML